MIHLVVLRYRNLDISECMNRDDIWPRVLLKFHGFNRAGLGAAEARENTSKKGSRTCYCKLCEVSKSKGNRNVNPQLHTW